MKKEKAFTIVLIVELNFLPLMLNLKGTGWPSFSEALPGAFKTKIDYSFGMRRVEYHCANCGVHHGHVFDDGPTESHKRFCNNGLCLIFKPE